MKSRIYLSIFLCVTALGVLNRASSFMELFKEESPEREYVETLKEQKERLENLDRELKEKYEHRRRKLEEALEERTRLTALEEGKVEITIDELQKNLQTLEKQRTSVEKTMQDIQKLKTDLEKGEVDPRTLKEVSQKIPLIDKAVADIEKKMAEALEPVRKKLEFVTSLRIAKVGADAQQEFNSLISEQEQLNPQEKMHRFHKLLVIALVFVGLARMRFDELFKIGGKHSKILKEIGKVLSKSLDIYVGLLEAAEAGAQPYKEEVEKKKSTGQSSETKFNQEADILNKRYQQVMQRMNELRTPGNLARLQRDHPTLYQAAAAYLPSTISYESIQGLD